MEIILKRTYHPTGVNGIIINSGKIVCRSIELPWKENSKGESCIPEGRYKIILRTSQTYGTCFELSNVPNRSGILIHPANDAITELRGCIAPVLKIISPGKGIFSRKAMKKILDLSLSRLQSKQNVYLIIKS